MLCVRKVRIGEWYPYIGFASPLYPHRRFEAMGIKGGGMRAARSLYF